MTTPKDEASTEMPEAEEEAPQPEKKKKKPRTRNRRSSDAPKSGRGGAFSGNAPRQPEYNVRQGHRTLTYRGNTWEDFARFPVIDEPYVWIQPVVITMRGMSILSATEGAHPPYSGDVDLRSMLSADDFWRRAVDEYILRLEKEKSTQYSYKRLNNPASFWQYINLYMQTLGMCMVAVRSHKYEGYSPIHNTVFSFARRNYSRSVLLGLISALTALPMFSYFHNLAVHHAQVVCHEGIFGAHAFRHIVPTDALLKGTVAMKIGDTAANEFAAHELQEANYHTSLIFNIREGLSRLQAIATGQSAQLVADKIGRAHV